jgi:hypothetical protein
MSNNGMHPTPYWRAFHVRCLWARVMPSDGADASRRAIGAADDHPLSVRRFAPAIKRLQRTVVPASPLARPPAADPQRR